MQLIDLQKKLLESQKNQDALRVSVLRFLIAAVKNKEIELRAQKQTLSEDDIFKVIKKQVKQHKDSIESFKQGNREDLVVKETAELEVLYELEPSLR